MICTFVTEWRIPVLQDRSWKEITDLESWLSSWWNGESVTLIRLFN